MFPIMYISYKTIVICLLLMYLNHTYVTFVDFKLDYNDFLINEWNKITSLIEIFIEEL